MTKINSPTFNVLSFFCELLVEYESADDLEVEGMLDETSCSGLPCLSFSLFSLTEIFVSVVVSETGITSFSPFGSIATVVDPAGDGGGCSSR